MPPPHQWDDAKQRSNLGKHRLDFAALANFDWDNAAIIASNRYGEPRFVAYGYLESRMYAVVFTWRNGARRIISFRKANPREVREYG